MANEFYSPGEQRAAKVNELFTRIAPRYDFINDVQSFGLHRTWKRRLVRLAEVQPSERALDLCCGTGDLAFALAAQGAEVTGLDFSEEMLRVAREKSKVQGPSVFSRGGGIRRDRKSKVGTTSNPKSGIEFVRGDAQRIPFSESTFDIITIGYGLRNLADMDMGLREMLRVCKPGGRLLTLEFGKPDNRLWRAIYYGYLRTFLPPYGKVFCGSASAYAYILESLKQYPGQNEVATRMRDAGWEGVRIVNLMGGTMSIHCAEKFKARSH